MQNFEVCFFNPMWPGDPERWVVKARNGIEAVMDANFSFFNGRKNKSYFLVKETNERELKTAEKWSIEPYVLVDSPVSGYKQVSNKAV